MTFTNRTTSSPIGGGILPLLTRRTVTGATGDNTGTRVNIAGIDTIMFIFRVYSITGTAPTSNNVFVYWDYDVNGIIHNVDVGTLSRTAPGIANLSKVDVAAPQMHVYHAWGGGDATTKIDFEVFAYLTFRKGD